MHTPIITAHFSTHPSFILFFTPALHSILLPHTSPSPCPTHDHPVLSFLPTPPVTLSLPHPSPLLSFHPFHHPQTPADCVQYYYLSKKRENFKHLIRKANLKRKKPFIKPPDYSNTPLSPSSIPPLPLTLFASAKPKAEDAMSADEDSTPFPSGKQWKDSTCLENAYK